MDLLHRLLVFRPFIVVVVPVVVVPVVVVPVVVTGGIVVVVERTH